LGYSAQKTSFSKNLEAAFGTWYCLQIITTQAVPKFLFSAFIQQLTVGDGLGRFRGGMKIAQIINNYY
jgi:hypothetical protein